MVLSDGVVSHRTGFGKFRNKYYYLFVVVVVGFFWKIEVQGGRKPIVKRFVETVKTLK